MPSGLSPYQLLNNSISGLYRKVTGKQFKIHFKEGKYVFNKSAYQGINNLFNCGYYPQRITEIFVVQIYKTLKFMIISVILYLEKV